MSISNDPQVSLILTVVTRIHLAIHKVAKGNRGALASIVQLEVPRDVEHSPRDAEDEGDEPDSAPIPSDKEVEVDYAFGPKGL